MTQGQDDSPRHWFVTGATGGLGRSITEYALQQGDSVTATARRADGLDDLRRRYGDRLTVEVLDLSPPADVDTVISRVLAAHPVDVVVNNAGYALVGAVEEMSPEQIRDQIEVLLVAPILITRAFLKPMREQGGGRIIQISSLGGQTAVPTHSGYHAGKWGLEGFTESVAQEVADFGIHLTLVEIGATRTSFLSGMRFVEPTPPYEPTAAGQLRRAMRDADAGTLLTGDPRKIAALVYATTRQSAPPLRLVLGADSYEAIRSALTERLAAMAPQESVAASVRFTE